MNEERLGQLVHEALELAQDIQDNPDQPVEPDSIIILFRMVAVLAGCVLGWPGPDEEPEQEQDRLQ